MAIKARVTGEKELLRALNNLPANVGNKLKKAVAETVLLTETKAKQLAPVDTGRLRSSINGNIATDGFSGTVSTNVDYAVSVEFGTYKSRAQPFLFPAWEENRKGFINSLKNIFK